jgi:hypothetical protein
VSSETIQRDGGVWTTAVLFTLIAAIYLCFPTKNYYWDGIAFAQAIEGAPQIHPSLVHPNHLIYNLVGYIFYRALQFAGFNLRAVTALQIFNSLCSALTAILLFRILKGTLRSIYYAITLTLLFAFSATWWKYSTDADAYIPSILLLLLSFYFALPWRKPNPVLVALIYALSLLLHQMAIIFFPVLVLAIFIQDEALPRKRRVINCLVFSVIAGGLTLGAYVYSFYLLTGGFHLQNFLRWTLSYAPDDSFGFRPWINLGFTLRGHNRLFFGGRFNAISGLINPFIVLLMALWVALFLTLAVKVVRSLRKPGWAWLSLIRRDPQRRKLAKLCLFWIVVYLVVLYIYVAHHTYYRLFYLPALIILLALILDAYQQITGTSRKYRLAIFVALVTVTNFLMVIFPYTHVEKYPPLAFALEMNQAWPRNTIIYYGSANSDNNLVKYFNQGTNWKKLEFEQREPLEQELRRAKAEGINVWLETSAIDQLAASPSGSEWLKQHVKPESQRALITKAHNIRFVQVGPSNR